MKKLFIIAAFGMLVSCTEKSNWTDETKSSFTTECVSGASAAMSQEDATKYCDCMLEKIMKKYPDSEKVGEINMDEMTSMAEDCI